MSSTILPRLDPLTSRSLHRTANLVLVTAVIVWISSPLSGVQWRDRAIRMGAFSTFAFPWNLFRRDTNLRPWPRRAKSPSLAPLSPIPCHAESSHCRGFQE